MGWELTNKFCQFPAHRKIMKFWPVRSEDFITFQFIKISKGEICLILYKIFCLKVPCPVFFLY